MTATSTTSTSTSGTFVTVPGDRHSEVARTLAEPVPQALSLLDQLGYVSWWASAWTSVASAIGFTPAGWMSASICSFVVSAVATLLVGGLAALNRSRGRPGPADQRATAA